MKRRNGNAIAAQHRKGAGHHKSESNASKKEMHMNMTLKEFREEHGIQNGSDMMSALEEWSVDSIVPALCREGCEVEPDGTCEHGCPSILVKLGVI